MISTEDILKSTVQSLVSIGPQLPTPAQFESMMAVAEQAAKRGHFMPDEDEQVRSLFACYLRTRAGLTTTLRELEPLLLGSNQVQGSERLRVFAVAFCTACMLLRSARALVDGCRKNRVIWKKLDEAEPRYGIPRKQFTQIYRSLTSPRNAWIFLTGVEYADENAEQLSRLEEDPVVGPAIRLLQQERPFIETSRRQYASGRLKYRWHSFLRRHNSGFKKFTFALFKMSGSLIAEMRLKWKRKRVTPGVRRKIAKILEPGDIIITRHDDAASNLFLPGFWPHGALYIGTAAQRAELNVSMTEERQSRSEDPVCVLEARKDGVLFRQLEDTFSVDAFTVLRPKLESCHLREALTRAITHEGKKYDFEFDFRRSDRLVCTEVIYRGYHGIGPINFGLTTRAGRVCLSAEDLLDCAVDDGLFEVVAVYGASGNRFVTGDRARDVLMRSYKSTDETSSKFSN
ncbi:MAG: YiiX/YebB-like N1pC/P60 family cysteine hydrolase [Planctomycetota bacterium]